MLTRRQLLTSIVGAALAAPLVGGAVSPREHADAWVDGYEAGWDASQAALDDARAEGYNDGHETATLRAESRAALGLSPPDQGGG